LLLLRSQAQLHNQNGSIYYSARPGQGKMDFGYELVRLWERPVEAVLAGGPATLPLAPLCRLPEGMSLEEGMRWVLTQVVDRLQREGDPRLVPRLLTATYVLSGLRLNRNQLRTLIQGVPAMRESDTYQAILDEGRVESSQRTLLRLVRKRLGDPDEATQNTILGINDLDRLDRLLDRYLEVTTWQELLLTP